MSHPLSYNELVKLRKIAHELEQFNPKHPKYNQYKKIYPFLATIKAEPADLTPSLLTKLHNAIVAEKDIDREIKITGFTKGLHADTAEETFEISRSYLYTFEYQQRASNAFFGSKKQNIYYDGLNTERKKIIANMEAGKPASQTQAKKITITTKKKIWYY